MLRVLRLLFVIALSSAPICVRADDPGSLQATATPTQHWTGVYIGALGSYTRGDVLTLNQPVDLRGIGGGGFVGAAINLGGILVGIEADGLRANAKGDYHYPFTGNVLTAELPDLWSLTGRVGVPLGRALLYLKGGFAQGKLEHTFIYCTQCAAPVRAPFDNNHSGWRAGVGLDYMLGSHLFLRVEGNFVDLGKSSYPEILLERDVLRASRAVQEARLGAHEAELQASIFLVGVGLRY